MTTPLLETKFYVPRSRRGLVPRLRLSQRMDRAVASKLTLVSAPAGFGKTTMLAEWLVTGPPAPTSERSAAWLSLDQGDSAPASFWAYVIAALRRVEPEVGATALTLLQSPEPPPIQTVLTTLINDLSDLANDLVLVLDDFHLIDARDVQDGMAFLLEHLPPQVHVVIASRADPALPLARLRVQGELVEIRAADLRFTLDEAATYLSTVMGLALSAGDVAALEGRTEGWVAALQLAALSMQGRDDVAGFIEGFAGDDRHIVDYLAEEVLQRQPEDVRHFLLQTSILDRLCGPLCDAVTGKDGGKAHLAALERGNLFLVPLDDRRRWFRYHHLFADVLQAHLLEQAPENLPELHRRASEWYEQNNEPSEAIRHAIAGKNFARAADLVESLTPSMRRNRQVVTLRRWLDALPDELVRGRPVLSVGYAGVMLLDGEIEGVEDRLLDAERALQSTTIRSGPHVRAGEMAFADTEELRRLPAIIELYRAGLAQGRGDVLDTVSHARSALELSPREDHLVRASAAGLLGLAFWASGDLPNAHEAYSECMTGLQKVGYASDAFGCAIALADIRVTQGRLGEAMRTYQQALQTAPEQGGSVLRGTADMYVGMSQIHRERNDLPAAAGDLLRSQELGEHAGLPQNRYRWQVAMARIREAEGDLDSALDLLDEAERVYASDLFPDVRPISAMRARVWVAQGRLAQAASWVREGGLSATDDLSYLREYEHITLSRVLLAGDPDDDSAIALRDGTRLLERLLSTAEDGARTGSVIEILVLQALAHQTQGDLPAALAPLKRAVTLAEPEGYVRVFADEGPPMAALLRAATRVAPREHGAGASKHVRRLLAAVGETADSTPFEVGSAQPRQGLREPLSKRELEVLRLLGTDLDGPDIARELVVSLNTMRTHTRNIYAKLGVNSRRAAVRRAEKLGLLSRTRDR